MTARTGRRPSRAAAVVVASAMLLLAPATALAEPRSSDDSCPAGEVPEDGFTDVDAGNVHEAAIDCVVWWGVAQGTTATTYNPTGTVTRAQMASFIARMLDRVGHEFPAAVPDAFGDDDGSPHEANIDKLAAAGIVAGTGPGAYSPDLAVSRAQMASFLVRAYSARTQEPLADPGPQFGDTAGNTHESNINRAAGAGFTAGTAAGVYSPNAPVRRDAMASFLTRVLDLLVEDGLAAPPSLVPPPPPPDDGDNTPPPPPDEEPAPPPPPNDGGGDAPPGDPPGA
jgi:hypothetical protein